MRGASWQIVVAVVAGVVAWCWYQSSTRLPPVSGGFVHPAYQPVADLFRKMVEDGAELGGSFAVYRKGEKLVDLWGGYANPLSRRPWREDTLTAVYSVTKGMAALCVAILVDRGFLNYKEEIRKYWPEFVQNGKSNITLEMLMSHQAGLVSMGGQSITLDEYKNNWNKVETLMAQATPDFPPGTVVAYHGLTFAMYIDAIIRKVDPQRRNLSQFFAEEISEPLDAEFYIGLPLQQYYRATVQVFPPAWGVLAWLVDPLHVSFLLDLMDSTSVTARMFSVLRDDLMPYGMNDPYTLEVGLGSVLGFGSARSLARIYDYLANGGAIDGRTLLSRHLVETVGAPRTLSLPAAGRLRFDFSLGFMALNNTRREMLLGHPGHGGQIGAAVPQHGVAFAYVTNFLMHKPMSLPDHFWELEKVFFECFKKHQAALKEGSVDTMLKKDE